jgi:uncharacterized GH25 family protein
MRRGRRGLWLTAAFALATTAGVAAHDFWIEPSTFEPGVGGVVRLHLRVGEQFSGDAVARDDARIERFVVAGPAGEADVRGRDGMDPAGLLRLDRAGTWVVGYRSRPSSVRLEAAAFEQYLKEEGLERVIDERARRGESRAPGREIFSRSVKAILRAGGAGADGFDRVLGLTLELVPERDPANLPDGRLPVRLLHAGRPLEGALVVAMRKRAGESGPGEVTASVRSDRDGRVVIPIAPGVWLIKAVHMRRADAGTDADWESLWASLTFRAP